MLTEQQHYMLQLVTQAKLGTIRLGGDVYLFSEEFRGSDPDVINLNLVEAGALNPGQAVIYPPGQKDPRPARSSKDVADALGIYEEMYSDRRHILIRLADVDMQAVERAANRIIERAEQELQHLAECAGAPRGLRVDRHGTILSIDIVRQIADADHVIANLDQLNMAAGFGSPFRFRDGVLSADNRIGTDEGIQHVSEALARAGFA